MGDSNKTSGLEKIATLSSVLKIFAAFSEEHSTLDGDPPIHRINGVIVHYEDINTALFDDIVRKGRKRCAREKIRHSREQSTEMTLYLRDTSSS